LKAQTWRVGKPDTKDLKDAKRLLSESELPVEGLEEAELWCVKGQSGGLIGVAGLERWGTQGLVRSVAVDGGQRRLGVGKVLVERVLEEASVSNLAELYLITETAPRFFEKFGFTPLERKNVKGDVLNSVEFKGACPDTAPVMRLKLK
jgi:amino-acid N-acetyltransferase